MLELIHDNRTGKKLEIVIPALNEEARLTRLVQYYTPRFDLVLLDDDSSDGTAQRILDAGGTVFRRTVKDVPPEAHLAHYVNHLTRSGMCFWMFADEYIALERLAEMEDALRAEASSVLCLRVEYFFARKTLTYSGQIPRGFVPGAVRYNPEFLHNSLAAVPVAGRRPHPVRFEVAHLHLWSVAGTYGTRGRYISTEVEQFRALRRPFSYLRFFRRFVVTWGIYVLGKCWRERHLSFAARLFTVVDRSVTLGIAVMSWIEQAYLPTLEQQKAEYAKFFEPPAGPGKPV